MAGSTRSGGKGVPPLGSALFQSRSGMREKEGGRHEEREREGRGKSFPGTYREKALPRAEGGGGR